MKSMATFVLIALLCVSAKAQLGGMGGGGPATQAMSIELELMEMEQEADKAALKEAFLLQARRGMKPIQGTETEKRQFAEDAAALRDFIAKKKESIIERAAEVRKARVAGLPPAARNARADQQDKSDQQTRLDQQATFEKYAEAQINVQLLETQLALLQEPLNAAVNNLAAAEFAASAAINDETKAANARAARKEFEKIKARYAGYSKQLQVERQGMQQVERQQVRMMGGMGGMGGGMR
jgi:hypothetical protein